MTSAITLDGRLWRAAARRHSDERHASGISPAKLIVRLADQTPATLKSSPVGAHGGRTSRSPA